MATKSLWTINRRQFLQVTGGSLACWTLLANTQASETPPSGPTPLFPKSRASVDLIFCEEDAETTAREDYSPRARLLTTILTTACPRIEFTRHTVRNKEEAASILLRSKEKDGMVVVVTGSDTEVARTLVHSGKPVVLVEDRRQRTERPMPLLAELRCTSLPVVTTSARDLREVLNAVWMLRVLHEMRESTILIVTQQDVTSMAENIRSLFGTRVVRMDAAALRTSLQAVDAQEAQRWADR